MQFAMTTTTIDLFHNANDYVLYELTIMAERPRHLMLAA